MLELGFTDKISEKYRGIEVKLFTKTQSDNPLPTPEDIRMARDYVDAIHTELRQSSEQQQRANKKLFDLSKSIKRMEQGLSATTRLKAEADRLASENTKIQQDVAQKTALAAELDSKLRYLERLHSDTRDELERAKQDIAARVDIDTSQKNQLQTLQRDCVTLSTKLEDREARLINAGTVNEQLQSELHNRAAEISKNKREYLELQKSHELVLSEVDKYARNRDLTEVELKTQRHEYDDLKSRYVEAVSNLENARYNAKAQKSVFAETLKRREEENSVLKAKIDQASAQVRIKDDMSSHLDQEISSLRNHLQTDRERLVMLEQRFVEKTQEADDNAQALERARQEYELLNEKFSTALQDVEALRRTTMVQQTQLDRYAALGNRADPQTILPSERASLEASPSDAAMDFSRSEYAEAQLAENRYVGERYHEEGLYDEAETAADEFYSVLKTG